MCRSKNANGAIEVTQAFKCFVSFSSTNYKPLEREYFMREVQSTLDYTQRNSMSTRRMLDNGECTKKKVRGRFPFDYDAAIKVACLKDRKLQIISQSIKNLNEKARESGHHRVSRNSTHPAQSTTGGGGKNCKCSTSVTQ